MSSIDRIGFLSQPIRSHYLKGTRRYQVLAQRERDSLVRKALQHLSSLCMTMSSMTFELNLNDATSLLRVEAADVGHTEKGKMKFPTM